MLGTEASINYEAPIVIPLTIQRNEYILFSGKRQCKKNIISGRIPCSLHLQVSIIFKYTPCITEPCVHKTKEL